MKRRTKKSKRDVIAIYGKTVNEKTQAKSLLYFA